MWKKIQGFCSLTRLLSKEIAWQQWCDEKSKLRVELSVGEATGAR